MRILSPRAPVGMLRIGCGSLLLAVLAAGPAFSQAALPEQSRDKRMIVSVNRPVAAVGPRQEKTIGTITWAWDGMEPAVGVSSVTHRRNTVPDPETGINPLFHNNAYRNLVTIEVSYRKEARIDNLTSLQVAVDYLCIADDCSIGEVNPIEYFTRGYSRPGQIHGPSVFSVGLSWRF